MATRSEDAATAALRACMRVQRAHVDVVGGIRTAVIIFILIAGAYRLGMLDYGLALTIGALFAAIGDCTDSFPRRIRAMAWCTLWSALGTLIGGLISDNIIVHIGVGFIMAAACGYAGALGARGGLFGTLTLVLFAVFGGTDIGTGVALIDASFVILGGIGYILIAIAPWPFHRLGTVRLAIARAYRDFAQATTRTGLEVAAPTVAMEVMNARVVLDNCGVQGATADWTRGLLTDLERARLGLVALHALRPEHPDYIGNVIRAAGVLARRIGDSLILPGREDVAGALEALEAFGSSAPTPEIATLVEDLTAPLRDAAARARKPWPVGPRAEIKHPPITPLPIIPRLKAHWNRSDPVFEHAARLMIAFGLANAFAVISEIPHAFWFPMTVAWVTKPDLSGTVTRVFMRVLGTILGLVIVGILAFTLDLTPWTDYGMVACVAVAAFIAIAYIWANYPVAVVGITMYVLCFEHLAGSDIKTDLFARLVFTVMAGVWVLIIAFLRPRHGATTAVAALTRTADAIRVYMAAVRDDGDVAAARAALTRERSAALAAVAAAATEPRGLWEREGPALDPAEGAVLLTDALDAVSLIVVEELLHERDEDDPELWTRVDTALADMDQRLAGLSASEPAVRE